jgi:hypothetical protein
MKVCQARAYCLSLFEQLNVLDIFIYRMLDVKVISFKFFYNLFYSVCLFRASLYKLLVELS